MYRNPKAHADLQLIIAGELIYAVGVYLTKATILLLYLRIFGSDRQINVVIHGLLVVLAAYYIATIGVKSAICIPLRRLWDPEIDGHCINNTVTLLTDCAVSIISDFAILILPIRHVWALQLPVRSKVQLTIVFATGTLYEIIIGRRTLQLTLLYGACVSSIMRLYYSVVSVSSEDKTFNYVQVWLWRYFTSDRTVLIRLSKRSRSQLRDYLRLPPYPAILHPARPYEALKTRW